MPFPVPPHDGDRVDALRALRILDTPPEPAFDDIAELAATLCSTPVAAVTFVDARRRWTKAVVGLPAVEAPRQDSFCAHVVANRSGVLHVPDAHADPRWAAFSDVTGQPWLRAYAGAPVINPEGHALGTVWVADHQPRRLPAPALRGLVALARQTAALLELRRQSGRAAPADAEARRSGLEDALTGLANATIMHDRLEQALRSRGRTQTEVGVVLCDIDGFRAVNDRLGREAGDELLKLVAMRLALSARGSDTLARAAGDRFVLVCPGLAGQADVEAIRARLRDTVEEPVTLRGTSFVPRVTVAAVLARGDEDADAALRSADVALHAAKRAATVS